MALKYKFHFIFQSGHCIWNFKFKSDAQSHSSQNLPFNLYTMFDIHVILSSLLRSEKVLALMQNAHEPLQNLHLKWSEWSLMSLYQGQLCFCLHPCNIRASLCIWTPVRLVKNRSMNCQCRFLSSFTLLLCLLHWCPICVGHCFGFNDYWKQKHWVMGKKT